MKLNLPNQLTLLRLVLIPPFLFLVFSSNVWMRLGAFFIFGLASLTDYLDGRIARERGLETTLGKFMDPLADKLLISSALIAFVQIDEFYVPAWMVALIIGREFLITGLRTLAVSQGRVLSAQPAGKFKTTSQIVSILTILIILTINAGLEQGQGVSPGTLLEASGLAYAGGWFLLNAPYWLVLATTLLTIVSGTIYFRDNVDLFNEEKS